MGRESGFAVARNWSLNREEILYEKQNGWKTFGGNQVYLDIVVGGTLCGNWSSPSRCNSQSLISCFSSFSPRMQMSSQL